MAPPSRTQIRINALERLVKEHELYVKEDEDLSAALNALKMQRPSIDEYEVRKTQQVLDETRKVLPRVQHQLEEQLAVVNGLTGLRPEEIEAQTTAVRRAEDYLAKFEKA